MITLTPPVELSDPPALTLVEQGGTVVDEQDAGSRADLANVVVARGEDPGDPARTPVVAIARDEDPTSPTYYPAYGEVVEFLASPLLTTTAQAFAAATNRLKRRQLRARAAPLDVIPDPRVRPLVRVDYALADGTTPRGVVHSTRLPLTASGGAASVTIGGLK